jgi:hypothetical protein
MRTLLCFLAAFAWALWLGGLMTLFLMVSHLFSADRNTAVVAAPRMFLAFERYQILLAAALLVASAVWRLREPRAMLTGLFFTVAIASMGAILSTMIITPKMEALRKAGHGSTPEFRSLHGRSMMVYTSEAALLVIAGIILTRAMTTPPPETAPAVAAASTPPAASSDRRPSPPADHPHPAPPPSAPA